VKDDNAKLSGEAAYQEALREVPRRSDGGFEDKELQDLIAAKLQFDVDAEKQAKAKRIIDGHRTPGSSDPHGMVCLPGFERYAYEPARLVMDNDHHSIEQDAALTPYKAAEAERARNNLQRVIIHSNRKNTESELFNEWVIQELKAGQNFEFLTYGAFLRATGLWSQGEAEIEDQP
jgi:hypothetical protein